MSTFRRAPWYLKLMLVLLPCVALLRLVALTLGVQAAFNPAVKGHVSVAGLAIDVASVLVVGAAAWSVWRPRPVSRWFAGAAVLLVIGYNVYGSVRPSPPPISLPRIPANESSPGYQFGEFLAPVIAVFWAYVCLFGRRAKEFFGVSRPAAA